MAADSSPARIRAQRGSITLVALCLTTALGIALGSYLALCSRSVQFSTRLLNQDKAREFAQVGFEEALWALNQNSWSSSGPSGSTAWGTSGANRTITLPYTLPGQGGSAQVVVTVTNYASTGPTWPGITSIATITLESGEAFTKTLQATTAPTPLFGNAIASSESYVSFVAAGTVDSWNSDPDNNSATAAIPYSFTAGNSANYNAVVAGNDNGTYGVVLTQATVRGYVATFGKPVSYATSGSPAGSIVGPTTPVGIKVDTARIGKSAFVPVSPVFDVSTPATSGAYYGGLIGTLLDLLAKILTLPSANIFKATNLTVDGGLLYGNATISKPIKIIVDGDLDIKNGLLGTKGKITINPTGSLEMYVTGDITIGADGFDNKTGDPKKLAIFSLSAASTPIIYNTTEDFCGVIYSENKPIDIRQNATFEGALLSRQYVRFSASATAPIFHYDTALRQVRFEQVSTPYIIKQVTEP